MAEKLTVRHILKLPVFIGARVRAGSGGLERQVQTIRVGETVYTPEWIRGGDFIFGALPFLSSVDSEEARTALLCRWTRELNQSGASALGVMLGLYLDELPRELLEMAEQMDFPIVEFSRDTDQREVLESVMRELFLARERERRRATFAFMQLCQTMVGPHRLASVATRLANFAENPVVIENERFEFLTASEMTGEDVRGMLRARRAPEVVQALAARAAATDGQESPMVTAFSDNGRSRTQLTWPVKARERTIGYLSLIELRRPILGEHQLLLETCLGAVALDMSQQFFVESELWRVRRELFELLLREPPEEAAVRHMAEVLGLELGREHTALFIRLKTEPAAACALHGAEPERFEYAVSAAVRTVRETVESAQLRTFLCVWHGNVLALAENAGRSPETMKKLATRLWERLVAAQPHVSVRVGLGRPGQGLHALRESCIEAQDTVDCICRFRRSESVLRYDELGQSALLLPVLREQETARSYCRNILGALIDRDRANGTELLRTLQVYLESNCNLSETGRVLCLHPKSVRYRIDQIAQLLPVGLSSFGDRSAVGLALSLYQGLEEERGSQRP